jgi:serine/threonine protein kinase
VPSALGLCCDAREEPAGSLHPAVPCRCPRLTPDPRPTPPTPASAPSYDILLPKRTSLRHRVPSGDEGFLDFLSYLLTPDPAQRPSAEEALAHPWLRQPYPPIEPMQD